MSGVSEIQRVHDAVVGLRERAIRENRPIAHSEIMPLVRLILSGARPYSDEEEQVGAIFVHVLEFGGDGDWGGHWFSTLPPQDAVLHLRDDSDEEITVRVEEVHFLESDPDVGAGEVILYVIPMTEDTEH